MRKHLALLVGFLLCAPSAGCLTADSDGGPAGLSIYPDVLFTGRVRDVFVVADEAHFDSQTVLSLGDGITVGEIEVLAPDALVATVVIDPAAVPGGRTVTAGVDSGSIELKPPLQISLLTGTEQAGGLSVYDVVNLDESSPFQFDITFEVSPGASVIGGASFNETEGQVTIRYDAYGTPTPVSLLTRTGGVDSIAIDAFLAVENPIQDISPATGFSPNLNTPGAVALGRVTLAPGEVLELDVSSTGPSVPRLALLDPVDGTRAGVVHELLPERPYFLSSDTGASWVLALEDGQPLGFPLAGQVTGVLTSRTAGLLTEAEDNDSTGNANALDGQLPAMVATNAQDFADEDFFSIDLSGYGNAAIVQAVTTRASAGNLAIGDTYLVAYEDAGGGPTQIAIRDDSYLRYATMNVGLIGNSGYVASSSSPANQADTGAYLASFWVLDARLGADAEPNDDALNATPLGIGTSVVPASIGAPGDADYYEFTLAADARVTIETGPSGAGTLVYEDTYLTLYDDNDTELAANEDIDDSVYGGYFYSRVRQTLSAGTYRVRVESSPVFNPTDVGDYRLMVIVD